MRRAGRRGLRAALAAATCAVLTGCDAPPELQPDTVLRDSLGLTSRDRVHTVEVRLDGPRESGTPDHVVVRPGDWLAFRADDGFGHRVHFERDSLQGASLAWAQGRGLSAGPPLIARGVRWLVHFEGAPPGRYPYRLEGNRRDGRGVVLVDAGRRLPFYTSGR